MINALLILGVAVVLPLAVGGRWWWWAAAAGCVAASLAWLPTGWPAAVLVAPWAAAGLAVTATALRECAPVTCRSAARVVAAGYSVVAAGALCTSRLGLRLLGIGEPIVKLTAVHYTYAGAAALILAAAALPTPAGRRPPVAYWAVGLTAGAPPIVALGFVTGSAAPQIGGAVLMTIGVWLTASLELRAVAAGREKGAARGLLAVSGVAIWIPMVLALAWAAGQHWNVPALSIPDMARTHGVANAVAFVLCGLAGRRLAAVSR